jgi:hypothetical protein
MISIFYLNKQITSTVHLLQINILYSYILHETGLQFIMNVFSEAKKY